MTDKLEKALAKYVDSKRRTRQVELALSLAELLGDAASRQWAMNLAQDERKSNEFLSNRLRELSR